MTFLQLLEQRDQWRRLHGTRRGTFPSPTFTNGLARGAPRVEEQQTKKLTKLYWPSRKRSPKRLIVLLERKKWRGTTKIFPALAPDRCLPPTFKFVPAALWLRPGHKGCVYETDGLLQ